jgi:hypothetical protein
MNESNSQLVDALGKATLVKSYIDGWNLVMDRVSNQITLDRYDNRGAQYNRNLFTVAALLCCNPELRDLFVKNGGNLKQFDNAVAHAQAIMLAEAQKPNPVLKIAKILNTIVDDR